MSLRFTFCILLAWWVAIPDVYAAPKSIMVDASTVLKGREAYELRAWMNTICENHRTPGSDDYIHNLVLMEIGRREWSGGSWEYQGDKDTAVLDTEVLGILEDYYECFDNVFVGTINLYGSDPYAPGGDMHDSTYRWDKIIYPSRKLAEAYDARFRERFPQGAFHWYISYEANLNFFTDATLRAEYAAVFLELIDDFHRLRPGTAVLWSPNFWTWYSSLSGSARTTLITALNDFFTRSETDGLNWVHFQDFVGANSYHDCNTGGLGYHLDASNAIGYHDLMTQAAGGSLDSLRINMELFASGLGACSVFTCCAPGDPVEQAQREADYQAALVPIGASFELRYWYLTHYGPTGQECNQAEICNGVDDDCDRRVDEDGVCDEPDGGREDGGDPGVDAGDPGVDGGDPGMDAGDSGVDGYDPGPDEGDPGQDPSDPGRDSGPDAADGGDEMADPGDSFTDHDAGEGKGCGCGATNGSGENLFWLLLILAACRHHVRWRSIFSV